MPNLLFIGRTNKMKEDRALFYAVIFCSGSIFGMLISISYELSLIIQLLRN